MVNRELCRSNVVMINRMINAGGSEMTIVMEWH